MTTQHTPGPWYRSPNGDYITDSNNCYVAQVTGASELAKPTAHANARLIAAAPEMLDALKALTLVVETLGHLGLAKECSYDLIKNAEYGRYVIAKATGKE